MKLNNHPGYEFPIPGISTHFFDPFPHQSVFNSLTQVWLPKYPAPPVMSVVCYNRILWNGAATDDGLQELEAGDCGYAWLIPVGMGCFEGETFDFTCELAFGIMKSSLCLGVG